MPNEKASDMLEKFFYLYSVQDLLTSKEGTKVLMNKYWIVFDGQVLRHKITKQWQCNSLEELLVNLINENPIYSSCEIVFYNFLYIPS